jgi:hypothetical protein
MNREEKAKRFAQLHVKGAPLLLYNAWDAGSARSVLEASAKAIATSSWSVAAAQGGAGRRTGRRADIRVCRGSRSPCEEIAGIFGALRTQLPQEVPPLQQAT